MTTHDMLDVRYGRVGAARRRLITGGIVGAVALAAIGGLAWMTIIGAMDDVAADDTGYRIVDAHSVVLNFQISAPPGADVVCALEAQDESHGIVGWRIIEIAASDVHARALQETIPTVARAVTGLVNSCWVS